MYNQSSAEKEAHPKASRASIMTICDCNTAIYFYGITTKLNCIISPGKPSFL
jgi:hypothetical protein